MSALFSPATLRGVTLPNRIVVSPMCQYSAERGEATAWHMIHLGDLALSGAGMLFIEATAVEPDGRITPGDLGLWDDATEAALKPVLAAIRKHSKIAVTMQLAHAGRKASSHVPWDGGQLIPVSEGGWLPCAPSALPHKEGEAPPLALDTAGLIRVREAFVASAKRAARLGIDGTRTAWRARLSAASVPLADRQPAHRRIRRLARKPHALSARSLRCGARAFPGRQTGRRARVGDRTGSRAAGTSRTPSRSRRS